MPHWNCERCGARLYSASRTLKRNHCPVCSGRIIPAEPPARFGREACGGEEETPRARRSVDAGRP
jgi:DNA-directed RNA polymerase subunit RPC12/RpoP